MPPERPIAIVLAGINGAGKTTASQALIADQLALMSFVNADTVARGLNAFAPETAAIQAGRIVLTHLHELAEQRSDLAFETTLAGRTYLPFLRALREDGYVVELYYFWLDSPELAIERVHARVRRGGHNIPEATIRQRYGRSIQNFWHDYRHQADARYVYDNSEDQPVLIAAGSCGEAPEVADPDRWHAFQVEAGNA